MNKKVFQKGTFSLHYDLRGSGLGSVFHGIVFPSLQRNSTTPSSWAGRNPRSGVANERPLESFQACPEGKKPVTIVDGWARCLLNGLVVSARGHNPLH